MFLDGFLRSPRHLLALFLALTLLPTAGLVCAGWLLIQKDKSLEQNNIQKRRDEVTRSIGAELQLALLKTARQLGDPSAWQGLAMDDAFIVVIGPQSVQTIPQTRLLYYPVQPQPPDVTEARSFSTEADVGKLRALTRSADPAVRAGAAVQLAILLRTTGRSAEALDVYAHLAEQAGVTVTGIPADLVARIARSGLFFALNRKSELQREAERLDSELQASRWPLDRGSYEQYSDALAGWLGRNGTAAVAERQILAERLDGLWKQWQDSPDPERFTASLRLGNKFATLVWNGTRDRLAVLVAGPFYLERVWLSKLESLSVHPDLRLTLQDAAHLNVVGDSTDEEFTSSFSTDPTRLPWTVLVANRNPKETSAQSDARTRLYLAGLGILLVCVAAGSFFVERSVRRELAVARLQSDFVAAVSHEFRTPLTSIRQVAELLSDGRQPNPERLPGYYQMQMRSTERLQRLVESLLDFGRMEARAKPDRMQRFALSEWTRSKIEEFQSEHAWNHHRIDYQAHCDNGAVAMAYGDPDALGSALRNLIDNAVKYSPGSDTVWVELGRRDGRLTVSVRDEGFGVPASERKQIFRKFVRGAASKIHGIKGTGIGLAMVEQIVRAHDGGIQLDSQPGVGSTFTIVLPESRN